MGQPVKTAVMVLLLAVLWMEDTHAEPQMAAADSLRLCDQAYETGDLNDSARLAREILTRDSHCAEAAWRLSRALIANGNLTQENNCRHGLFTDAASFAELAIREDPDGSQGFTCLAICQGSLSGLAGGRHKIELAEAARTSAQRAIELDPGNPLAYLVLGVWNREVATLSGLTKLAAKIVYGGIPRGASLDESESCLRRAVNLAPHRVNPRRELGITLMAMKRYEEAVAAFAAAATLPPLAPADSLYIEDARERLKQANIKLNEPPDFDLH